MKALNSKLRSLLSNGWTWLISSLYYIILVLIHTAYNYVRSWQVENLFLWRDLRRTLANYLSSPQCQCDSVCSGAELNEIYKSVGKLSKIPSHIAIAVSAEQRNYSIGGKDVIDLKKLAKVVSWAWAAHASTISLYDHFGQIKSMSKDLEYLIQREFNQNSKLSQKPPLIKFHNTSRDSSIHSNGLIGLTPKGELHIILYAVEDGREAIINSAKDLFQENLDLQTESSSTPPPHDNEKLRIAENRLDSYLKRDQSHWSGPDCSTDPELLIILGQIQSTLGFLPWHIRLTEIHWIPHLNTIEWKEFLQAIQNYSNCHQRFGT